MVRNPAHLASSHIHGRWDVVRLPLHQQSYMGIGTKGGNLFFVKGATYKLRALFAFLAAYNR